MSNVQSPTYVCPVVSDEFFSGKFLVKIKWRKISALSWTDPLALRQVMIQTRIFFFQDASYEFYVEQLLVHLQLSPTSPDRLSVRS